MDRVKVVLNVALYPVKLLDGLWHIVQRVQITSKTYVDNMDETFDNKEDAENFCRTFMTREKEIDVEID